MIEKGQRMKKLPILIMLIPVLLVGCPKQKDPTIPQPFTDDDPAWCDEGCDALRDLPGQDGFPGCLEARPLVHPDLCQLDSECEVGRCVASHCTETCEEFCRALIENGRFLGAKCWTTINSCEEIETTCRR
jgi:hypothetical protein